MERSILKLNPPGIAAVKSVSGVFIDETPGVNSLPAFISTNFMVVPAILTLYLLLKDAFASIACFKS